MNRRFWTPLITIGVLAVTLVIVNLAAGNRPVLGLDLQGGVSAVLAPTDKDTTTEQLLEVRDLLHEDLVGRGIDEPSVRVEGRSVVVDLPGVTDQRDAVRAVDGAGQVVVRPLYTCVEATDDDEEGEAAADDSVVDSEPPATEALGREPIGTETLGSAPVGSEAVDSEPAGSEPDDESADSAPDDSTTTTTEPPLGPLGPNDFDPGSPEFTPPPPDAIDSTEAVPTADGEVECTVGPAQRGQNGELGPFFEPGSARVDTFRGEYIVVAKLTPVGQIIWSQASSACVQGAQTCPTQTLSIVMDGVVQSNQRISSPQLTDELQLNGPFTESEAHDFVRTINRGEFPVEMEVETVQTVSPTLGDNSYNAAVVAVLIGLALVAGLLAYLYRRLAAVAVGALAVWAVLVYSASAIVSSASNHAVTLAGVAGFVVSLAIAVDSSIVYFERLRDDVRHGRTIRNSAERSFRESWRTILTANFVALLVAIVLYAFTTGTVKSFGLYLGIATIANSLVCYLFTRPAVAMLASRDLLDDEHTFDLGTQS